MLNTVPAPPCGDASIVRREDRPGTLLTGGPGQGDCLFLEPNVVINNDNNADEGDRGNDDEVNDTAREQGLGGLRWRRRKGATTTRRPFACSVISGAGMSMVESAAGGGEMDWWDELGMMIVCC